MAPDLTDQELLDLLQNQLPEELSREQLAELRRRMRANPQIREALLIELQLEQGLATAHSPPPRKVEEMLAKVQQGAPAAPRPKWAVWVVLGAVALALAGGATVGVFRWRGSRDVPGGRDRPPPPAYVLAPTPQPATVPADDELGGDADPAQLAVAGANTNALTPSDLDWLLFDYPPARQDFSWLAALPFIFRPVEVLAEPVVAYHRRITIKGRYVLTAPPTEQRMLRLAFGSNKKFQLDLWAGRQGVRIEKTGEARWRGYLMTRAAAGGGLHGEWTGAMREGQFLGQRQRRRVDAQVDFDWGLGAPMAGMPADGFAVRWSALLEVPRDGQYRFHLTAEGLARLGVNGQTVVDRWAAPLSGEAVGDLSLKKGIHAIALEYANDSGPAAVRLEWEGPEIERQVLPASVLRSSAEEDAVRGFDGTYVWGRPLDVQIAPPTTLQLVEDDGGRVMAGGGGALDIRYQAGCIVLARGDVPLLSVPLHAPPGTGLLTMDGELAEAQLVPCQALPLPEDLGGRVVLVSDRPGELDWKIDDPNRGSLRQRTDGAMELAGVLANDTSGGGAKGTPPTKPAAVTGAAGATNRPVVRATLSVTPSSVVEVTLHTARLAPGAGFFARPAANHPGFAFEVAQDGAMRCLQASPPEKDEGPRRRAEGWVIARDLWWRITVGTRRVLLSFSRDGSRWASLVDQPLPGDGCPAEALAVGVFAPVGSGADRQVVVDHLRVRRFDALEQLADPALVARVPVDKLLVNPYNWLPVVDTLRPPEVPALAWRCACDAAVGSAPGSGLARAAAEADLFFLAAETAANPEDLVRALEEAPHRLLPGYGVYYLAALSQVFDAAARRCHDEGRDDLLPRLRRLWMTQRWVAAGEMWGLSSVNPPLLERLEMYRLLEARDWEGLLRQTRQLRYLLRAEDGALDRWELSHHPGDVGDLAGWLMLRAAANLPPRPAVAALAAQGQPMHPLVIESDQETCARLIELQTAVAAKAYDQAAQVLTRGPIAPGISSIGEDAQLFQSNLVFIREIINQTPELRQLLRQQYAVLAGLRLEQAMAADDTDAADALTAQFYGTDAAAAALRQLADRDLSLGNFESAAARYGQLLTEYAIPDAAALAAKRRLAGAMAGQSLGEPIPGPVTLPDAQWKAGEYEALIEKTLASHRVAAGGDGQADAGLRRSPPAPGPGDVALSLLPLSTVNKVATARRDPRPVAWEFSGDRVFIHRQGVIEALDLSAGRSIWKRDYPLKERKDADLSTGRPLAMPDGLFVTTLVNKSADLVALDPANGQVLWQRNYDDGVVSDPVRQGAWLYVLSMRNRPDNCVELTLRKLSAQSGESVMAAPLPRLRRSVGLLGVGRPVFAAGLFLFRTPGAVIAVDPLGDVRWVRRLLFVLPDLGAASPVRQALADLAVTDDRVIVTSPGSPQVLCLDVRTGTRLWSRFEPQLQQMVGLSGQKVVLACDRELVGLDTATGTPAWRTDLTIDPGSALLAGDDTILALRLDKPTPGVAPAAPPDKAVRRLFWLAAATGKSIRDIDLSSATTASEPRWLATDGRRIVALTPPPDSAPSPALLIIQPR